MTSILPVRRGISLLEVLISMGILTIGLVSVLSLVPTGRSYAVKATIYDRATAAGENAIADVINRGYLDPSRFSISGLSSIDALGVAAANPLVTTPFTPISTTTSWAMPAGNALPVAFALGASSDDLVYTIPANDDPPAPGRTTGGLPVAENRFSWVATLMGTDGRSLANLSPGARAVLSVVVFHRRDLSSSGLSYSGIASATTVEITGVTAATTKDFLHSGAIVLIGSGPTLNNSTWTWRRILLAAYADPTSTVALTIEGPYLSGAVTVYAFRGTVGLVERVVRLESPSPWSLP